jgi:metal-responsive CopG/Arc/MetJ family transcriptional regulator
MGKVLVSLDDELVRQVDGEARAQGLSRSAYLARAARRELERGAKSTVRRRRRALKALDDLFASASQGDAAADSTAEIRAARDER